MEMSNWKGAAGVCINEKDEVLLVLQGPPDEEKKWGVPSGPLEGGESLEESCEREFFEVTGLSVQVIGRLKVQEDSYDNADISIELHYFQVEVTGGQIVKMEDDPWIAEVSWKPVNEIRNLEWAYPAEIELIESVLEN